MKRWIERGGIMVLADPEAEAAEAEAAEQHRLALTECAAGRHKTIFRRCLHCNAVTAKPDANGETKT